MLKLFPLVALVSSFAAPALADDDTKKACVDASTEGQTSRDAGQLLSARDKFVICSAEACPAIVRSSCAGWLSEVEQQLPSIVIRAADSRNADITDGTATIDGAKHPLDGKPIALDPGKHMVVLDSSQGIHLEKSILLAAGEKSRLIELRVPAPVAAEKVPAPASPPKAQHASGGVPTGAWVLGGLGVVALGSFGYFAISASHELSHLKDTCSPGCTDAETKKGRREALIADISLGVGVAALAGAVTWTLLSGSSEQERQRAARLTVSPLPSGAYAAFSSQF